MTGVLSRFVLGQPNLLLPVLLVCFQVEVLVQQSRVRMAELDAADIAWYLDSGEWEGKAGAYGIQGRAAAFVAHLEGSHSGVMGLPLHETHVLLRRFGLAG